MIRRFYVHNFRCLENFELPIAGQSSVLLIGKNGSGKTTVGMALEVLQKIGRGTNRVGDLVKFKDLAGGRADVPMRFEIGVELDGKPYAYVIAFHFLEGFKELRVLDESLTVGGEAVYTRKGAQVDLARASTREGGTATSELLPLSSMRVSEFRIDWHLVALPIIQELSRKDPLFLFRQWLAGMLILRPIPGLILGESTQETLEPNGPVTDFGAWFTGLLAHAPSAYTKIDAYLKQVVPDLKDVKNPVVGTDFRSLEVQFSEGQRSLTVPFADLSDGEKCFMICALVLAASDAFSPVFCFWDEPDNYLSIDEVGYFVMALRRAFQSGGQLIATSHNPEAIRSFSDENTLMLYRKNHLEPTQVRPLSELEIEGDKIRALIRGDVEP